MKRLLLIIVLLCSLTQVFAQNRNIKPAGFIFNQIEPGKFPYIDLYITPVNSDKKPMTIPMEILNSYHFFHNGLPVDSTESETVGSLKRKGEYQLYVALVIDNSGSMQRDMAKLKKAAVQFIDSLKSGDQVAIFDFGKAKKGFLINSLDPQASIPEYKIPIFARQLTDFSSSKKHLRSIIIPEILSNGSESDFNGGLTPTTSLYDALGLAISRLNAIQELSQKIIICFSDGENNGGELSFDNIKNMVSENQTPIFAIDFNNRENGNLSRLASLTDGNYTRIENISAVDSLYQSILKILKYQLRVRYKNPEELGFYDTIRVEIQTEKAKPGFKRAFGLLPERAEMLFLSHMEATGSESEKMYLDYLEKYQKGVKADNVLIKLGNFWKNRGNYRSAYGAYSLVTRKPDSPFFSEAMIQKADLLTKISRYQEAQDALNKISANDVNPNIKARATLELAKSYSAQGNIQMAMATYKNLSVNYSGSDAASEALLQTASLSMEMGNLPDAQQELKSLVDLYGDSKSSVYAKMELAKISDQQGNSESALGLYHDIINETQIAEIKSEAQMSSARILMEKGMIQEAIPVLKELTELATEPELSSNAARMMVTAQISTGNRVEARNYFELLDPADQHNLTFSEPVSTTFESLPAVSLGNGALVAHKGILSVSGNPIEAVESAEFTEKFPVLGSLYQLPVLPVGTIVVLPVEPDWIDQGLVTSQTGIWAMEDNQWKKIESEIIERPRAYKFVYRRPGLVSIMSSPPKVVRLTNIYFDVDKSSIKKEAERNLFELIDDLKLIPDIKLEIGGHTDSTGNDEHNIELSGLRAGAIRDFLIRYGIQKDRLQVRGYGSQKPLASNSTEDGRQQNRRSEFTIFSGVQDTVSGISTASKTKFAVYLGPFRTLKDISDQKKFYSDRGYSAIIQTRLGDKKGQYFLNLGKFSTENESADFISGFISIFTQAKPIVQKE